MFWNHVVPAALAALNFSFLYVLSPTTKPEANPSWTVISSRFGPDGSVPGLAMGFTLQGAPDQLVAGEGVPLLQTSFLDISLPVPQEAPFPFTHRGWVTPSEAAQPALVVTTPTSSIPDALQAPLASLFTPHPVPDPLTLLLCSQASMGVEPFALAG